MNHEADMDPYFQNRKVSLMRLYLAFLHNNSINKTHTVYRFSTMYRVRVHYVGFGFGFGVHAVRHARPVGETVTQSWCRGVGLLFHLITLRAR